MIDAFWLLVPMNVSMKIVSNPMDLLIALKEMRKIQV